MEGPNRSSTISLVSAMVLGVAQHAGRELRIALVPVVDRAEADPQALAPIRDRPPGRGVRQRVALQRQARAGQVAGSARRENAHRGCAAERRPARPPC